MSKPWFIIGISMLSCLTVVAQKEAPPIRNIVLVHGAWADGSGWKGVYDILVKDGYNVSIVQEPETSLRKTWLQPSVSSLSKTVRAFWLLTVMAEQWSRKPATIPWSSG
jgi:hypothetical protein